MHRSHYGVEFRLDLVDASTDIAVGSALLTTQGLLQDQRDIVVNENGGSLLQFLKGPLRWSGKRPLKLELRTGFGSDYFSAPKGRRKSIDDEAVKEEAGMCAV